MTKREAELEAIVKALVPAARDILWCALVWNDHNFGYDEFMAKSERAAKSLKYDRFTGIECVNAWLARVDKVLGNTEKAT